MTRTRRVVMFSPGHGEAGGAARRSRVLAAALARHGWEVRVITRAGTLRRFTIGRSSNVTVIEVPGFGSRRLGAVLFLAVGLPLGLAFGARSEVFLAIQLVSPTTAGAVCSAVLRRPFVAMTSSSGQLSETAYVMHAPLSVLRTRLVRRAAFLVAQTEEVADELSRLVDRSRIAVIPTPVEVVSPPPLSGAPRAVYTGRLSEEKDLFRLLDAWRVIAEERSDAVLTLVGNGGSYRSVETRLRQTVSDDPVLRDSVTFTGWVADVAPFLTGSDVYVFPSLSEGMSNSLLEACAWGRVVVASDIPSNRAVLGDDYPLLFATGDTLSLLKALHQALDDPAVRADAVTAVTERARVCSVDVVAARLEATLEAAVRQNGRDR